MPLTDLALALLVRTAEQLEQQAVDLRSVIDEELTLAPHRAAPHAGYPIVILTTF